MPRFDRTGPEGAGPRTGRGLGKCSRFREEANVDSPRSGGGAGRGGFSRDGGQGRCLGRSGPWWTRWFRPDAASVGPEKVDALRSEVSSLKEEIAALKLRLEERDNKS